MPSAKGGINYLGSLAATDESIMYYTMQFLKQITYILLDNLTPISSIAFKVAQQNTLTAFKNMVLDFSQKHQSQREKNEIVKTGQSSELTVITIPFTS